VLPFGNKSILGNLHGMISTHVDIPRLTHLAMTQDLKLDKLVTEKFGLDQINDVAEKMLKRQMRGRWVLAWDHQTQKKRNGGGRTFGADQGPKVPVLPGHELLAHESCGRDFDYRKAFHYVAYLLPQGLVLLLQPL
jgi:hypothetical protein